MYIPFLLTNELIRTIGIEHQAPFHCLIYRNILYAVNIYSLQFFCIQNG